MTKPKSPRRAASPSTRSSNGSAKHSIGAAAAALHAATTTTATTTSAFERHSPPPSPRHLRHKDTSSPPSSPTSSGPTAASKEVKAKVKGALSDVKDVMNLAAKEFGAVVANKEFTSMESRAETAASAEEEADTADTSSPSSLTTVVDQKDLAVQDQKSTISSPSPSSSSSSSSFTTVTGSGARSGSGLGHGTGSGSSRDGGRSIPRPAVARSYLSNNLFDSLSLDQDSADKNGDGHESDSSSSSSSSSESSDDSDLDDTSSSESSESSNSSQSSEAEEEDEDEEEEEEDEEEQHERRIDPSSQTHEKVDSGNKAGPLLKKRWKKKPEQQVLEAQQRQSKASSVLHEHQQPQQQLQQQHHQHHHQHHHHEHSSLDNQEEPVNEPVVLLADQSAKAKWANWSVRTLWTLIMIGGFFACVAAGPAFVILLVVMVQGLVYKEVIYLAAVPSREKKLPWFRAMNWYFLFSTNYFFYGESLIHYFQHVVFVDAFLVPFATHHRFISFTLYVIGFVFFVANLKKGHYRFQFSQFAWTHMTLLLVVCQSHFIINNIFEGLIWFFLPVSLVIANDIWAYIFGFFWGKTPLIKLSPKKTVEGFVGGWIMTIVFGMLFATLFLQYPYMICPVKDLRATAFSGLTCDPNPVFIPVKYHLKPWMVSLVRHLGLRHNYVMIAPLQLHTIFMACFASLIAPFGGFFASGFKRAFKIKDFGQSIPGHGGITDRMDCQFLMGLFSYMYYQSFIKTSAITVGVVLQSAIHNLNGQEQMELFDHMRQYLIGQGLLDEESCVIIPPKEAWIS